ncbi:hypothetical protein MMC21_005722 [Puttea exsequens]|nr:hypothetical protein [Puttea exsequens]
MVTPFTTAGHRGFKFRRTGDDDKDDDPVSLLPSSSSLLSQPTGHPFATGIVGPSATTEDIITTQIVYTTLSTCSGSTTVISGTKTTESVTTFLSTVTRTSTSTICTKCIAPPKSKPEISSTSPGETITNTLPSFITLSLNGVDFPSLKITTSVRNGIFGTGTAPALVDSIVMTKNGPTAPFGSKTTSKPEGPLGTAPSFSRSISSYAPSLVASASLIPTITGYGIVPSPSSVPGGSGPYSNATSSVLPVYSPGLLGNGYGGGFVQTASIFATKLPSPNGLSSGVPPGYGFTSKAKSFAAISSGSLATPITLGNSEVIIVSSPRETGSLPSPFVPSLPVAVSLTVSVASIEASAASAAFNSAIASGVSPAEASQAAISAAAANPVNPILSLATAASNSAIAAGSPLVEASQAGLSAAAAVSGNPVVSAASIAFSSAIVAGLSPAEASQAGVSAAAAAFAISASAAVTANPVISAASVAFSSAVAAGSPLMEASQVGLSAAAAVSPNPVVSAASVGFSSAFAAGSSPAEASQAGVSAAAAAVFAISASAASNFPAESPAAPGFGLASDSFSATAFIASMTAAARVNGPITSPAEGSHVVENGQTLVEIGAIRSPSATTEEAGVPVTLLPQSDSPAPTSTSAQSAGGGQSPNVLTPVIGANGATSLAVIPTPVVGANGLTSLGVFSSPVTAANGDLPPAVILTPVVGNNGLTSLAVLATPVVGANGLTSLAIGLDSENVATQSIGAPTVSSPAKSGIQSGSVPPPITATGTSGTPVQSLNPGSGGSSNSTVHVSLNPTKISQFEGAASRISLGLSGLAGLMSFLLTL